MGYTKLLAQLLPAKSYDTSAKNLSLSLKMEGQALDKAFANCTNVISALDPFYNQTWVAMWERIYSFPSLHLAESITYQEKLQMLALAFQERLGSSKDWFKRLALLLGYNIDIKEYTPFRVGQAAGKALTNALWVYVFVIKTNGSIARCFKAGRSKPGEQISQWGNSLLEHVMNIYKPAHTCVRFAYHSNQAELR